MDVNQSADSPQTAIAQGVSRIAELPGVVSTALVVTECHRRLTTEAADSCSLGVRLADDKPTIGRWYVVRRAITSTSLWIGIVPHKARHTCGI
jgi:hypothetical protein